MSGRFWVLGPVDMDGDRRRMMWGVVDPRDFPGQQPARKPRGYQEFWPTEREAQVHADQMSAALNAAE